LTTTRYILFAAVLLKRAHLVFSLLLNIWRDTRTVYSVEYIL